MRVGVSETIDLNVYNGTHDIHKYHLNMTLVFCLIPVMNYY